MQIPLQVTFRGMPTSPAFDAAKRQLEDFARVQRGDVKHHGA